MTAEAFPLVYVVILNWNGHADTVECVRSCLKITYEPVRILVVDNGSSDGSERLLRSEFPEIEVIQTGANLGFAGGNNVGIRHALDHGADYVLLLNNDTLVDRDFIAPLVDAAEADPDAGILGSKIYFHEPADVLWYAGATFYPAIGWGRHRGYGQRDTGQYDEPGETGRPTGCAMMATRRLCETIGLLREEMFCYAEDLDWGLRARNAGFKVLYVPASKVWHKVTRSTGGVASPVSQYYTIRNTLLCLDLNAPLPLPLRALRYITAIAPGAIGAVKQPGPKIARLRAIAKGVRHYFQNTYGAHR
jgi:GT2 family glycosyltransferase